MKAESIYHYISDLNQLFEQHSGDELIPCFHNYLERLLNTGLRTDRSHYFSSETVTIVTELIQYYGDSYTEQVVTFLAGPAYTLLSKVCEKTNVFKYLIEHIDTVLEVANKNSNVIGLVSSCYYNHAIELYGKKVFESVGNRGDSYLGFFNNFRSNMHYDEIECVMGLKFHLEIDVSIYDILEIGKALQISDATLTDLTEVSKCTSFLNIDKNTDRKRATPTTEMIFIQSFTQFVCEIAPLTINRSDMRAAPSNMFLKLSDVNTKYFIRYEVIVPFHSEYEALSAELINTIRSFNQLEDEYYGFTHMVEWAEAFHCKNRKKESFQPLFG